MGQKQADRNVREIAPTKTYVLDTNVLIHDPNSILNFEEHLVVIPVTVLEELDKLKQGNSSIAADCRQAIRLIDKVLGDATPEDIERGVPITREDGTGTRGSLAILMDSTNISSGLSADNNDNRIINNLLQRADKQREMMQAAGPDSAAASLSSGPVILVSKDINMRLKARSCGVDAQDYHTDQLVSDLDQLTAGYHEYAGSFWDGYKDLKVETKDGREVLHTVPVSDQLVDAAINEYIFDDMGFVGRIAQVERSHVTIADLSRNKIENKDAWGLVPRDKFQAAALDLLLNPDIHLVTLTGAAGSGKTILALAAALEMTVALKMYKRIIVTRSTQGLDQDIGFLPGTEAEKMEPWLGAITDNLEALHQDDADGDGSIEYIMQKIPVQFKSLNYIRGRSFQHSLMLIDECQNLTPHQVKTIITRAGTGSKVICLGNLAQIDTAYLSATSSGLTYLIKRLRHFPKGGNIHLQGVPRSELAEFAESNL